MKVIVSGISNALNDFYDETQKLFTNQGDTVLYEAYNFDKQYYDSDIVFLVFDGLPLNFFENQNIYSTGIVIPIFIDSSKFYVGGILKQSYQQGEVCSTCMLGRMKEIIGVSPMYDCIFSQTNFNMVMVRKLTICNFMRSLLSYIVNSDKKLCQNLLVYSFDTNTFFTNYQIGYTKCSNCDFYDYNQSTKLFNEMEAL